jgi:dienelactone hydrolase
MANGSMKSDIGNVYSFLENYVSGIRQEYSYMTGNWADFEQWKTVAKAKVFELLNYSPQEAQLDPEILNVSEEKGYRREELEFNTAKEVRVRGSFLVPHSGSAPYPAVIAIHDHGSFYYYGREKILEMENEPSILTEFKQHFYGSRSWASELARSGYAVLTIDGFYFGNRKLDLGSVSEEMFGIVTQLNVKGLEEGTDEYIRRYNEICWNFEMLVVRHILCAGTTWPGILLHDDRKCVDYLLTRNEVNKDLIGCCGLSLGGFRSAYLAALDSRIRCTVVTGWMPTCKSLLFNRLRNHTFMVNVPGLTRYMELPDLMSLTAPNALFVQQCLQDSLYNVEGMQDACRMIGGVYAKIGMQEKYQFEFYDNGHEFHIGMQDDAFRWLNRWLKPE